MIFCKMNLVDYLHGIPHARIILMKSFGNYRSFVGGLRTKVDKMFPKQDKDYMEPAWIKCKDGCDSVLEEYIQKEMHSTAYILRCLQMSMINAPLTIYCTNIAKVSGVWEDDKTLFKMGTFKQSAGRLIMGFGPSASGKTYWAEKIIDMLSHLEPNFPKAFMSIDGGTYREASVVYQTIIKSVTDKNIGGLSNLMSAGFSFETSLFSSGKVKQAISAYLKTQPPPNLYVPDTLGGCKGGLSKKGFCSNLYKKYKDITKDNDNWIGLCIWQHVEDTMCVFGPEYKCIGCKESGKERERREGKQYSDAAWGNSFYSGIANAKKANKWFVIHNTGGRMFDKTFPCINLIESNVKIPRKIQKKYNCEVYDQIKIKL